MNVFDNYRRSDHLKPVKNIWDLYDFELKYYLDLKKILLKDLPNPLIRFMSLESFNPESVLEIHKSDNNKYHLIFRFTDQIIWSNQNQANIELKEYKCCIDKSSAQLIKSLFVKAINQVKYPTYDGFGLDGDQYFFFVEDLEMKAGRVWSPSTPKMKKLVEIGVQLIQLAKNNTAAISFDSEFIEEINNLIIDL